MGQLFSSTLKVSHDLQTGVSGHVQLGITSQVQVSVLSCVQGSVQLNEQSHRVGQPHASMSARFTKLLKIKVHHRLVRRVRLRRT